MQEKDIAMAYVLWFFLGFLGIHRFYLDRPVSGLLYFFTGAFCGVGWIVDLFLIPSMVDECNNSFALPNAPIYYEQPHPVLYQVNQPQYVQSY